MFDLDDTLHDDTATYRKAAQAVAADVAEKYGCDAVMLFEAYVEQAERFWRDLTPEGLGTPLAAVRPRLWAAALAEVMLSDVDLAAQCAAAYGRYRRTAFVLWPGALELLTRLRQQGYKLGLITNGFAETHREKIALLALDDAFDEIFIADEIGLLKPDPRLFRLAAERLDVDPEACAMVGDRLERDIRGAQAAGMFTIWMNVRAEALPARGLQPDAVVTEIGAVEAALASRS